MAHQGRMHEALEVNLKTIRTYSLSVGHGVPGEKDRIILREASINVYNFHLREAAGMELNCKKPYLTFMSEKFLSRWRVDNKSSGVSEHVVPLKVIVKHLSTLQKLEEIDAYLRENLKIVKITLEEDQLLTKCGLKDCMSENALTRYELAGIEIHHNLINVARRTIR